jgi:hypothetical protein
MSTKNREGHSKFVHYSLNEHEPRMSRYMPFILQNAHHEQELPCRTHLTHNGKEKDAREQTA